MKIVTDWIPAFVMMALIYWVSSQPSSNLPNFDLFDKVVKKGGHMMGYGLLALSYLRGLQAQRIHTKGEAHPLFVAWIIAIIYAITDEYHQSFVPGRFASIWDVLVFDNFGALIALFFYSHFTSRHQAPNSPK